MFSSLQNDKKLVWSAGDQPAQKKRKTLNADGPIEDEELARTKLRDAGFDPDDVHTARSDHTRPVNYISGWRDITPMAHFAFHGDLPMCRYLFHVRGASTTKAAQKHRTSAIGRDGTAPFWKPLYGAIYEKRYDVAKWLYKNGAKDEIFEKAVGRTGTDIIPFQVPFDQAADEYGNEGKAVDFFKWLIMQGVLDHRSKVTFRDLLGNLFLNDRHCLGQDPETWEIQTVHWSKIKQYYLSWANELIKSIKAFRTFLLGTWRAPEYSVTELKKLLVQKTGNFLASSMLLDSAVAHGSAKAIWDSFMAQSRSPARNKCLGSFPGVLERIAEFLGVVKSKKERRNIEHFRRIMKMLENPYRR